MANPLRLEDIIHPSALLFGKRLKTRRKALGLTQAMLIGQTGLTIGYLSAIEKGRANPSLDLMLRLANAVGLEIWEMLRPEPAELDSPRDR